MNSMIEKTVVIDWFDEIKPEFGSAYAIVAIDVIRATTTAITGVALGRKCYPVSSIEEATSVAKKLKNPLMVGELGGNMPYGFDLQNSPAQLEKRDDLSRPMVLLSTSGTRLITEYKSNKALFIACLRNYKTLTSHLAINQPKVALVGAGTRGEFREEDQLCAAWIADGLWQQGYKPENENTSKIIERWRGAPLETIRKGNSASYLLRSGQSEDLDFVLNHVDDLHFIYQFKDNQIIELPFISVQADRVK